eukprot:7383384-Prymnesium_polylepis.1
MRMWGVRHAVGCGLEPRRRGHPHPPGRRLPRVPAGMAIAPIGWRLASSADRRSAASTVRGRHARGLATADAKRRSNEHTVKYPGSLVRAASYEALSTCPDPETPKASQNSRALTTQNVQDTTHERLRPSKDALREGPSTTQGGRTSHPGGCGFFDLVRICDLDGNVG